MTEPPISEPSLLPVRRWVFDASPLIALGKAGLLGLVGEMSIDAIVPEQVAREVDAGDVADAARIWLRGSPRVTIASAPVLPIVSAWNLGDGESAAISYALDHPGFEVVLDERAARACAVTLGLRPRGTLGILVLAKRQGRITEIRPHIEALLRAGYRLSPTLIAVVLDDVGEDPL